MARTDLSLQQVTERARIDGRLEGGRVDLLHRRMEDGVDPKGLEPRPVGLERTRIAAEVLARAELAWVHKDADHHPLVVTPRSDDEGIVAGVERAHRRDQPDLVTGLPPGHGLLLHGHRRLYQERSSGRSTRAQRWGRRRP